MKILGFSMLVIAALILNAVWFDTREGPPVRAGCYIAIAAGVFFYFEGLKREIIAKCASKNGWPQKEHLPGK